MSLIERNLSISRGAWRERGHTFGDLVKADRVKVVAIHADVERAPHWWQAAMAMTIEVPRAKVRPIPNAHRIVAKHDDERVATYSTLRELK